MSPHGGMEYVHPYSYNLANGTDKQVITRQELAGAYKESIPDGHQFYMDPYQQSPTASPYKPVTEAPSRRKPRYLGLVIAVLVAILAAVIGGVVGWKVTQRAYAGANGASNSSTGGSGSSTCVPSTADTGGSGAGGASRTIAANSTLTATGWRYGTDFSIRLFYQGPDSLIRYSVYDTLYQNWSVPRSLSLTVPSYVPMAATIIWWTNTATVSSYPFYLWVSTALAKPNAPVLRTVEASPIAKSQPLTNLPYKFEPPIPQVEFFYLSPASKLFCQNWGGNGWPASGVADLLDGFGYSFDASTNPDNNTIVPRTELAAFWPSIVGMDDAGNLEEFFYAMGPGWVEPVPLNVSGTPHSAMVALPVTPGHTGKELRVVYRRPNGNLYTFDRGSDGTVLASSGALPFTVPAGAPLAGFATARDADTTNTYLLWQDSSAAAGANATGGILFAMQDEGSTWRGPVTDPVFTGADVPTQLACVTAGASWSNGPSSQGLVVGANDMNRCYFQVGGALKEVWYNGTDWIDLGFVYMP